MSNWLHMRRRLSETTERMDRFELIIRHLQHQVTRMAIDFSRLAADVAANGAAIQSAIAALKAVVSDPDAQKKIDAIADQVEAQTAGLVSALAPAPAAETPAS